MGAKICRNVCKEDGVGTIGGACASAAIDPQTFCLYLKKESWVGELLEKAGSLVMITQEGEPWLVLPRNFVSNRYSPVGPSSSLAAISLLPNSAGSADVTLRMK